MHTSIKRHDTDLSTSIRSSRRSDESCESRSTAPTSVFYSPHPSPRPSLQHSSSPAPTYCKVTYDTDITPHTTLEGRDSTDSYPSTTASAEVLYDEPEDLDLEEIEYHIPEYKDTNVESESKASTPQDFAQYFPSQRRLCIRHDETTYDGNMNLRVDTEVSEHCKRMYMQLFHLRMHDLKKREFSLRRYCRDSGREVCHSSRRYTDPGSQKPGFQRSVSNAFASLRSRPEFKRSNSGGSVKYAPQRHDSGYGSDGEDDLFDDEVSSFMSSENRLKSSSSPVPTNITKLEFSNYAQVEVKRRGTKNSKRYEFEYWGSVYNWKRVVNRDSAGQSVSYHLVKGDSRLPIAHIVPELRSQAQIHDEEAAGGWVPPCSMWISDPAVLSAVTDVADVIVATGLIALVDDCIKRHFGPAPKPKFSRQISLPLTPLKGHVDFVGPKALVKHVFSRRNSSDKESEKEGHGHGHGYEHRNSPLRYANFVEAH